MMNLAIDVAARCAPRRDAVVTLSGDGTCAVARDGDVIRIVGGRPLVCGARVVAAAQLEHAIWLVSCEPGEHVLHRFERTGEPAAPPIALGWLGDDVMISALRSGPRVALVEGDRAVLLRDQGGELTVEPLGARARDRRVLLGALGLVERCGGALVHRRAGAVTELALPRDLLAGTVRSGSIVLDGVAGLFELTTHDRGTGLLYDLRRGELRARIRLGEARVLAIAERAGAVLLGRGAHLALLDLRSGRCTHERILAAPVAACAIDAGGRRVIAVDESGGVTELGYSLGGAAVTAETSDEPHVDAPAHVPDAPHEHPVLAEPPPIEPQPPATPRRPEPQPQAAPPSPEASPRRESEFEPAALCALVPTPSCKLTRAELAAYLADLHALLEATCQRCVAVGIETGRLVAPPAPPAAPGDSLAVLVAATQRFARWTQDAAPHIQIARELGLSSLALMILVLAAGPQLRGELARDYHTCCGDPARPLVDELLIAHLYEADAATRAEISRELDPDAPLVATGAVVVGPTLRPYAAISVHPAIARRLAGAEPAADLADGTPIASCSLNDVIGPRARIAEVARELRAPRRTPARVVLRGRPHAGRRSVATALAAQAGRGLGLVALDGDEQLRARLQDVALRGDIPCVLLDGMPDDPALRARVRMVLDRHRGPLFVRAPRGGEVPLEPGYAVIDFAPLEETDRCTAWRTMLASHGLDDTPAQALAKRFRAGPGAIARACASAARSADGPGLEDALIAVMRQQRSARIEAVATRVERLATWSELIVPDDIAESLQELGARVHHRRTVLEDWGMAGVASTARGVTALFQGAPGTGKTMAAEVLAHELGYELWRVDLSKVVSKWIGETEKNLGAVFDAAEDGEIVLLFDEADSLFGKRTAVTSSHDRNANLETNYLLQRLDTFAGVAILTTNFGTAIDPAFLRRLSVQVQFPFPDEQDRERLWRALLPPSLPIAEPLDLAALAHKYELTGGYIRNAVLRAAYVAAGRGSPLCNSDLDRAVRAEYRARGKIAADGKL